MKHIAWLSLKYFLLALIASAVLYTMYVYWLATLLVGSALYLRNK